MKSETNNAGILLSKLDAFIRKYYLNQVIRGSLYSLTLLSVLFTTFVLLEHYVFTSSVSSIAFRKFLFYSFLGTSLVSLAVWVGIPLLKYARLGRVISYEQAAMIVGEHFSNVKDKLLNTLQLRRQAEANPDDALLLAGIAQKTEALKLVPFQAAIDLKENRRYLRFVLPPLFLIIGLGVFSNIISNSTHRILRNSDEFEREALFKFVLPEAELKVVQFEDYDLVVKVEGEALPLEVFIEVDNYNYKLERVNANTFRYKFYKLQKDQSFRLQANGFATRTYKLDVLEKPNLAHFDIEAEYPAYLGRPAERFSNADNLVLPLGTKLRWKFRAQYTDDLALRFDGEDEKIVLEQAQPEMFEYERKVMRDGRYWLYASNANIKQADSMSYGLSVIPDLFPNIEVQKQVDSSNTKLIFFAGEASDDYGLRNLQFIYTIERGGKNEEKRIALPFMPGKQTVFDHVLNVADLQLKPGDKLSYYFQIWDNDGVNGSKSARTPVMSYEVPTLAELRQKEEKNNNSIKKNLEEALREAQQLKNQVKANQENILQKNQLNWQDRRELEKLIDQQKALEKKVDEAKKDFEENKKNQDEFQKVDEDLAKKQEELEKLFEELLSDDMKKMFEELEKMLDDLNKEELMDKLKDIEMGDQQLSKELDRMLELFKKMEVEKQMQDVVNQLDSLTKQQEQLSKETEQAAEKQDAAKQEQLKKEQDRLNEAFKELQEQLKKAQEKNEDLERPFKLDGKKMEQMQKDVEQNMKQSKQQLQQQQNQPASKSQKNAAQKMKEMSDQMKQDMNMNRQEKMEQDLKAIRQLLENLINLSFEQEDLLLRVEKTIPNTPAYVQLVQQQYKLKDDFRHIEDSLQSLAKQVFQLSSYINEKVSSVKKVMNKGLYHLEERQKSEALVQQEFSMTYVNDLALILSESMQQMQQQLAQQMPGQQMCEKPMDGQEGQPGGEGGPGQGKPGMQGLPDLQKGLGEQLKQMQEQMKNGQMPGSKEFAQAAAKQAAIRKALQDLQRKRQQEGKGKSGGKELQDLIDQMNKIETELVNKRLPNDINKRQQDILTRLLQSESAERERELDEKRQAQQAETIEPKMPPQLEEYLRQRRGQVNLFKTVSPNLRPYYKSLVEDYYRSLR